jgi:hypothetical protein
MKSFLLKGKRPIIKWGMLPDETYFEGTVPESFSLAVTPSEGYVVIDIDRHGNIDGEKNIPDDLRMEIFGTLNYETKNNGYHCWFKYTGNKPLGNKTSGLGIDLRTHKGYVVYYPDNDIREQLHLIKETSPRLNKWLERLFSYI